MPITLTNPAAVLVAWFVMLVVSIANGAVRDFFYGKHMGALAAHQLSTAISLVLLGTVIWSYVTLYPPRSDHEAVVVGLAWLALTVAFEFLFFHYVGGHSWSDLLANYNVLKGRIWVFVPLWIAVAPWLFYRLARS